MNEYDKGFLCGILVGEGSFGGDKKYPCIHVKMHVRSKNTIQWLYDHVLGSKIYGPYLHNKRNYYMWVLRGEALKKFLPILDTLGIIDNHVMNRYIRMKQKYNLVEHNYP